MSNQVMPYYKPGLGNSAAYQVSGVPWLSGTVLPAANFGTNQSEVRFRFPSISRTISVVNSGNAPLKVHFNSLADGNVSASHHYVKLPANKDSFTFNVRVNEIYISLLTSGDGDGECEVIVERTAIPSKEALILTGSGLTE